MSFRREQRNRRQRQRLSGRLPVLLSYATKAALGVQIVSNPQPHRTEPVIDVTAANAELASVYFYHQAITRCERGQTYTLRINSVPGGGVRYRAYRN